MAHNRNTDTHTLTLTCESETHCHGSRHTGTQKRQTDGDMVLKGIHAQCQATLHVFTLHAVLLYTYKQPDKHRTFCNTYDYGKPKGSHSPAQPSATDMSTAGESYTCYLQIACVIQHNTKNRCDAIFISRPKRF